MHQYANRELRVASPLACFVVLFSNPSRSYFIFSSSSLFIWFDFSAVFLFYFRFDILFFFFVPALGFTELPAPFHETFLRSRSISSDFMLLLFFFVDVSSLTLLLLLQLFCTFRLIMFHSVPFIAGWSVSFLAVETDCQRKTKQNKTKKRRSFHFETFVELVALLRHFENTGKTL